VKKLVFLGRAGSSGRLEAGIVRSRQLRPERRLAERWAHNQSIVMLVLLDLIFAGNSTPIQPQITENRFRSASLS
jgi:hypothetical protein